jgi:hypothetical protein
LVEDGNTDLDEILNDRLNTLKAERDRANAALDRARPYAGSPIRREKPFGPAPTHFDEAAAYAAIARLAAWTS